MPVRALTIGVFFAACAILAGDAVAADAPESPASDAPAPAAPSPPPAGGKDSGLDGADAACLEWTDGCRVCARKEDKTFACSNISIACQPAQGRCTRR